MHNIGYLALANFVIFGFFFIYLLSVQKKNNDLKKEVELLKLEKTPKSSES